MKHYGIDLVEGSEITNLTVPTGTVFPNNPNAGELFYRSDTQLLYVYTTSWVATGIGNVNGYTHTQSTSSSTWTVTHNLDSTNIQFSVYVTIDMVQTAIFPSTVTFVDANTMEFSFSQAHTGKVILVKVV